MSSNTLHVETHVVGQMAVNCYVVSDGDEAVVIDPGDDGEYVIDKIQQSGSKLIGVIATHGHFDHIMAGLEVQLAFGAPFYIHHDDMFLVDQMSTSAMHFLHTKTDPPPRIDRTIDDRDVVPLGVFTFQILHTPGHTPGSITLYEPKSNIAFVGDVLFSDGAVGRTDFSYSKPLDLAESIKKILTLPPETVLYCGHGEPTTVAKERATHSII